MILTEALAAPKLQAPSSKLQGRSKSEKKTAERQRNAQERREEKKLTTENTETQSVSKSKSSSESKIKITKITKSYPDGEKWQENGGQKDKDRNGNTFASRLFA